ncbi:TPA: hypothetical protein ACIJTQ_001146 [Serratia marcescens]
MEWQELTIKLAKVTFESLPTLLWPAGVFATIFYFRKPLLSIFEKTSGIRIKAPFADIELEIPIETKVDLVEGGEKVNSEIDKHDELKVSGTTVHWMVDVLKLIDAGDMNGAETSFERYKQQERNPSELYKNEAYYFELMYVEGNNQSFISKLEQHISEAKNEQEKVAALISYTRVLDITKQYEKSIDILLEFIKQSSSEEVKSEAINRVAECYISNKEPAKARALILDVLQEFKNPLITSSLYVTLSKVEDSLGNKKIAALCLDKAAEFNPSDQEILFNSAFQASENNLSAISICNYKSIIGMDKKHAAALNNIAICAENEKLSLISIKYYKDAAEQNNSLAMVNQGFRLLNAGFSREAEDIANKALAQESPHQNVHSLLTSIHEKREKEIKEWTECQSKSENIQKATRKFISAYTRKPSVNITDSTWILDKTTIKPSVEIVEDGSKIVIKWQEDIHGSTSKYECSLAGEINNSSFDGKFFKFAFPKIQSTLLGPKDEPKLYDTYGFLDETESTLTFIDISGNKNPEIILKRL